MQTLLETDGGEQRPNGPQGIHKLIVEKVFKKIIVIYCHKNNIELPTKH